MSNFKEACEHFAAKRAANPDATLEGDPVPRFAFPNHPIIPTTPAVFDDSEFLSGRDPGDERADV